MAQHLPGEAPQPLPQPSFLLSHLEDFAINASAPLCSWVTISATLLCDLVSVTPPLWALVLSSVK